jgi:heme-degrading monooxygenase HmoA
MFARVSTILGTPERLEDGIRDYKENVLPAVKKMTGFKQAILMVDRKSGKSVGITFWDTEKNLQDSTSAANKLRTQAGKTTGSVQPPMVDIYEVAVKS